MNVKLHANARSTPALRREIQQSDLSIRELARRYNLSRPTVAKWKNRDSVEDASHRPHNMHTTLTAAQEIIVVELRKLLLLPVDDLLVIARQFVNAKLSRSALLRCLKRYGVNRLADLMPEQTTEKKAKTFKDYVPGFVHVDIKYLPKMPDEEAHKYLIVGIDRATRWVYMEVIANKTAEHAAAFLEHLHQAADFKITKVLTDNGKEFTDRFCATGEREPTGNHLFDKVCQNMGTEHRLIPPKHPQTNGMVERFNGRISELVVCTRFSSEKELHETLMHYMDVYNRDVPQRALGHLSPQQAMRKWREERPDLFRKSDNNLAGLDSLWISGQGVPQAGGTIGS